jgi:hypothetical protein
MKGGKKVVAGKVCFTEDAGGSGGREFSPTSMTVAGNGGEPQLAAVLKRKIPD